MKVATRKLSPHAAVPPHGALGPKALDVVELDQPDAAVDDHLRAAGVEVVSAAATLVHDLPVDALSG
jgi:hypothetical protein